VIDTRKNKVIATIPVGNGADRLRRLHPAAAPICRDAREGKLLRQERLGARPAVSWAQCGPAAALGFSGVRSLQDAILDFCELDKAAEHAPLDRKPEH